jgi:hypothetical protein
MGIVIQNPGGGGGGTVNLGTGGRLAYYAATGTAVSGNANATVSSGVLTLGVATSVQGQVILSGATSGAITVTGAAAAGTWTLTLPTSGGTNGYVLQTDGSGNTSWVSVSASSGTVTNTSGSLTAHAVVLGNGGNDEYTLSSLGTSGTVLTSNGAGADPSWQAVGSAAFNPIPSVSGNSYTTTAGYLTQGATGVANAALADGTNARIIPMMLFKGMAFTAMTTNQAFTTILSTPTYSQGSLTLVANQQTVGSVIHLRAGGTLTGGTSQTLIFEILLKNKAGWVGTANTASSGTTIPATTSAQWWVDAWIFCDTVGAASTATARTWGQGAIVGVSTNPQAIYPLVGAEVDMTTTIDTTTTQLVDLKFKFGANNGSNTITCTYCDVELK